STATPLTSAAVETLKTQRRQLGKIGPDNVWVFPAPATKDQSCSRSLVREWWERSARMAELPIGERYGWLGVRRAWASEMRDVNPRDSYALGGWTTCHLPLKHYIQPNIEARRGAFAERRELHGATRVKLT